MLRGRWLDNKALHAELDRIIKINRAEEAIVRALDRDGVAAALKVAKQIGARESSINELAYQFLRVDHEPGEALQLFRANVAMHPQVVAGEGVVGRGGALVAGCRFGKAFTTETQRTQRENRERKPSFFNSFFLGVFLCALCVSVVNRF